MSHPISNLLAWTQKCRPLLTILTLEYMRAFCKLQTRLARPLSFSSLNRVQCLYVTHTVRKKVRLKSCVICSPVSRLDIHSCTKGIPKVHRGGRILGVVAVVVITIPKSRNRRRLTNKGIRYVCHGIHGLLMKWH